MKFLFQKSWSMEEKVTLATPSLSLSSIFWRWGGSSSLLMHWTLGFGMEVKIGQLVLLCPAFWQWKQKPFSMQIFHSSIYIHSIWVLGSPSGGWGEVRVYGRRGGLVVFNLSGHNLIGLVPLGLKPFSFGIPFVNGGGYWVHGVDVTYECRV